MHSVPGAHTPASRAHENADTQSGHGSGMAQSTQLPLFTSQVAFGPLHSPSFVHITQ